MSVTVPFIFFGVAAFLLNIALGRLVLAQREQIATLKALGFSTLPIVMHYLKLVDGHCHDRIESWGGRRHPFRSRHDRELSRLLPFSVSRFRADAVVDPGGHAISFAAASLGRPDRPSRRRSAATRCRHAARCAAALSSRAWSKTFFRRLSAMLRHIAGRPFHTALTILGIAFAVPMVVLGLFWRDAIDRMIDVQFNLIERGNAVLTFPETVDRAILRDLAHESGVVTVEGQRIVPVRLRAAQRTYLSSVIRTARRAASCGARETSHAPHRPAARGHYPDQAPRRTARRGERRYHYGRGHGRPIGTRTYPSPQSSRKCSACLPIWRSARSTS